MYATEHLVSNWKVFLGSGMPSSKKSAYEKHSKKKAALPFFFPHGNIFT